MKGFVAIELPGEIQRALEEGLRPLRSRLPPARWVPPANWHLTLVFLGRVERDDLPALDARLSEAFAGERAFEVKLETSGTFPPGRSGRVVWVGFAASAPLSRLQAAVAEACASLGYPLERRAYSPHLTLARCRKPWGRAAIEVWSDADVPGAIGEPAFEVRRGCLFESVAQRRGVHYEVIRSYPLSGCTTDP